MCAHCEKAFEGRRHFEKKGQAYCERDYKAVSNDYLVSSPSWNEALINTGMLYSQATLVEVPVVNLC